MSVVRRRDAGYRVGGAGENRRVRRGVQRARDRAGLGAGQRPVACGVARAPHTGRTRAYAHVTGPTLTRTAGGRLAGVCGSTGATYLTARGLPGPWPVSVRWLSTESARRVGLQPSLPAGAAGAILYRFASADDGGTLHALQAEAVNAAGARLPFATAGKRPGVHLHPRRAGVPGA